jgi:hypothetical protein
MYVRSMSDMERGTHPTQQSGVLLEIKGLSPQRIIFRKCRGDEIVLLKGFDPLALDLAMPLRARTFSCASPPPADSGPYTKRHHIIDRNLHRCVLPALLSVRRPSLERIAHLIERHTISYYDHLVLPTGALSAVGRSGGWVLRRTG